MANARKSVFDQAGSYYLRQNYFAYNLRREEVEDLDARKNISDRAKWTWVRLKFVLLKSEEPGWLVENGDPMSIQSLATILRRYQPKALQKDVDELVQNGILKIHDGFLCDPHMVAEEAERRRNAARSEKSLAVFTGNSEESLAKQPKQTSGRPDVSNPQNGSGKGSSGDSFLEQTSGNSNSSRISTTIRSTETTSSSSSSSSSKDVQAAGQEDRREIDTPTTTARDSCGSPDGVASSPAYYWIEKVKADFSHLLNLEALVEKWLRMTSENPKWKLTEDKLRLFLRQEKRSAANSAATAAPEKPKTAEEYKARYDKDLRAMLGLYSRDDDTLDRDVNLTIQKICGCKRDMAEKIFGECAAHEIFVFYTHDQFETSEGNNVGWIGADACAKDECGIMRQLGSKWLVPGAYAALAEKRKREAEEKARREAEWKAKVEKSQAEYKAKQEAEERDRKAKQEARKRAQDEWERSQRERDLVMAREGDKLVDLPHVASAEQAYAL
jgi:hypothetical protein